MIFLVMFVDRRLDVQQGLYGKLLHEQWGESVIKANEEYKLGGYLYCFVVSCTSVCSFLFKDVQ